MNTHNSRRILALLVAVTALPVPLAADPIQLTGGTVQVEVNIHSARITFVGNNFSLSTGSEDFFANIALWPFPLSTPADLGGAWRPTDPSGATAFFEGVYYPEVYVGFGQSQGTFVTPLVPVVGSGTVTVPFTFSAVVSAFANFDALPGEDEPLFTTSLKGAGTARARFVILPADGGLPPVYFPTFLEGADYHLEYQFSAIPEPASVLLVATGIAAVAARQRRRGPVGRARSQ